MGDAWERLLPRLTEIRDLSSTLSLMSWDQHVMMPPPGAPSRARAMATIEGILHARVTDPEVAELLDELEASPPEDEGRAASVRVLRRDHDRAVKVPDDLVRAIAQHQSKCFHSWSEARAASDFGLLRPDLERMIALKKEEADAIGHGGERYDALLDGFEPEITTAEVETLFGDLVRRLRPLADAILAKADERPAFLSDDYEVDKQEAFCHWLIGVVGFDVDSGRLDRSPHPFTMHIGAGDVRQTTRYDPTDLLMSIRATMHETGHALYEQGLPEELLDLPAGNIRSLGLHESQSRLWEIQVGLSRPFADFVLPHLRDRFPAQLGNLGPDEFYAGINHPRRSMIRVISDEVTYNLHIALRFELELALFRDELEVADLSDAWNDAMERHVGIRPENDAEGVLQDMHWSIGGLGYFPTYTLGTLYAAAFFARAVADLGDLTEEFRRGDTSRLLGWLRTNIHEHASKSSGKETAERVLGTALTVDPFIDHLRTKYGDLYGSLD